jgi:hypothetical protein
MEYLMTYGWAILIIAVVLGVLFQLGVFSGSALTPKAAPGACQVVRLGGQASLEGECQGQLPQYVMQISEPVSGGSIAFMEVPNSNYLTFNPQHNFTISVWINVVTQTSGFINELYQIGFGNTTCNNDYMEGVIRNSYYSIQMTRGTAQPMFYQYSLNKWYNFVGTYNSISASSNMVALYADSTFVGGGAGGTSQMTTNNLFAGICSNPGAINLMDVANLQVYNASLSSNEIEALYAEGIGGAPIKIQDIAGWWPLNGNLNDYSGNNNNGQAHGSISFNGSWQSGYTPP